MARVRDRIIALVLAAVFFVTSVGIGLLVVWQSVTGNDEEENTVDNTNQLDQANQLAGTKLEDFAPVSDVTELKVTDLTQGDGPEAKADSIVTVDYTGAVAATGVIFQSSLDSGQQATFSLDEVIPGWKEGMIGMKQGGVRRMVIPASQAYGANPPSGSGIPANAALVFDVTLHEVSAGSEQ
jgi:FKBP-type peptidyl-prolyl cis-trans isomerase